MLQILLQIVVVLAALMALGVVLKIVALPILLVGGLLGFVLHNIVPIAIIGGAIWFFTSQNRRRLPGA